MNQADNLNLRRIEENVRHVRKKTRATWYVDATNGQAGYAGWYPERPFATPNQAIAVAAAGDLIKISEDTYDGDVTIPAGLAGLEVECEPGSIFTNSGAATVVSCAAPDVKWRGGRISEAGEIGLAVTGAGFEGEDIIVDGCTVSFDMDGTTPHLKNCHSRGHTTTGFDIADADHLLENCTSVGSGATRGFYFSAGGADRGLAIDCHSLNNTANGWEYVAGADNNMNVLCSQSSLCGGPVDAGANNSWVNFSLESLIVAGQSIQQDLADIHTDTAKLAGLEDPGTHSHVNNLNWQNVVTITTTARHKVHAIWLDMVNLTQNMNMRMQYEIDGANPRTFWVDTWVTTDEDGVLIDVPRAINNNLTLDIQSVVLEGAARDVFYDVIYEEME